MVFLTEDGITAENFHTKVGLAEGSSMSPLLFAVFISDLYDFLAEEGIILKDDMPETISFKLRISYIAYADDLGLLAGDEKGLRNVIPMSTYCYPPVLPNCSLVFVITT